MMPGLIIFFLDDINFTEIFVGFGIGRVQFYSMLIGGDSFVHALLPVVQNTQIVRPFSKIRALLIDPMLGLYRFIYIMVEREARQSTKEIAFFGLLILPSDGT